jgi:hypothetical protein
VPLEVVRSEFDGECAEVLVDALGPGRARNRDDVVSLGEHPGEGQLRRGDPLAVGQLLDSLDQRGVRRDVLRREPRMAPTVVAGGEIVLAADPTGQESAPERRVRDQSDPEFAEHGQHPGLHIPGPQRHLGLNRRDRVHGVRATDRVRSCLRESEVADLARLHELRHRPDGLLDRDPGIHPMLVEQVDVVGPESIQRAVDRTPDVLGPAVGAPLGILEAAVPELRREHDFVAS